MGSGTIQTRASKAVLAQLRRYESRNVTFIAPDGSWPIVWERAQGVHVWDSGGKRYLDLTAAFGVAAAGHANPRVVKAGQSQMGKLLHAMGDVHPHALKAKLARELSRLTFERWNTLYPDEFAGRPQPHAGKTIFCNSGFEAVEAALKTAMLATGKRGVLAFERAYHGLGYGALNATHREHFRRAFRKQLGQFGYFAPFPDQVPGQSAKRDSRSLAALRRRLEALFRQHAIGAILVEPVQVRGGIHVPPMEFLPLLRSLCDQHGALLILDEIYTGFGRTGKWFACEHSGVVPDLICLGKALTGGFPLSACVGHAGVMDQAWPPSQGEAVHTSTFLGHPVGCAMALAQIEELKRAQLVARSARLGEDLLSALSALARSPGPWRLQARGLGLLAGFEVRTQDNEPATSVVLRGIERLLRRGFIFLPEGAEANVLSFTPPLTISSSHLSSALEAVKDVLLT